MAVTGSGTQADPWIVHDYAEFKELNDTNTEKYIKFANVHIDNEGDFNIDGQGTLEEPYIVSTYEELLYATGATEVWQVKITSGYKKLYKFNNIYCVWNTTPTLINFSAPELYPSGMPGTLSIPNNVDFNGWTLANMLFPSGTAKTFNRGNKNVYFKRAFINNVESHYNELFALQMIECVLDIRWFPPVNGYSHIFSNYGSTNCGDITNCYIKIYCEKGTYDSTDYALDITSVSSGGYALLYDTILDLELKCGKFGQDSDYTHGVRLTRSILKGSTTATQNGNSVIFDGNISAILDFATPNMNTMYWTGYNNSSVCIYNSDKTTFSYLPSSWKGVTTVQLKDPAYLQSLGFSIGVDT